ncbi:hypothetical protein J6590_101987 [Homalodisca vitripennis]|nr:hypothetical protein J6590_101987 [Homalodisca vitripennis]
MCCSKHSLCSVTWLVITPGLQLIALLFLLTAVGFHRFWWYADVFVKPLTLFSDMVGHSSTPPTYSSIVSTNGDGFTSALVVCEWVVKSLTLFSGLVGHSCRPQTYCSIVSTNGGGFTSALVVCEWVVKSLTLFSGLVGHSCRPQTYCSIVSTNGGGFTSALVVCEWVVKSLTLFSGLVGHSCRPQTYCSIVSTNGGGFTSALVVCEWVVKSLTLKPSGKRAPMVANGMPDQNKTRVSQMLTSRNVHHGGRPSAERKSEGSLRPRMMER